MTVAELIAELQKIQDQETEVVIRAADYQLGEIWSVEQQSDRKGGKVVINGV